MSVHVWVLGCNTIMISTYRSAVMNHVPSVWFENIPTVKELDIDPRDAEDFYMHEEECFSWEHNVTSQGLYYMEDMREIHAVYDIRVHIHGSTDSVVMMLGDVHLPFTHLSDNFWLLKTFTRLQPLLHLPLHRNPVIDVQCEHPYTLSFCCCNLTPEMEEIVENDCYMNGPEWSKFIFTRNFFAFVENSLEDEEWYD